MKRDGHDQVRSFLVQIHMDKEGYADSIMYVSLLLFCSHICICCLLLNVCVWILCQRARYDSINAFRGITQTVLENVGVTNPDDRQIILVSLFDYPVRLSFDVRPNSVCAHQLFS